jgi:hypothetical protein
MRTKMSGYYTLLRMVIWEYNMNRNEKYLKKVRRNQRKLWFNDELAKLGAELAPIIKAQEALQKKRSALHKQM